MALIDDLLEGNVVTGLVLGIGAYLLAPTVGPMPRPAAKAVIKAGILAYRGLAVARVQAILPPKPNQNWTSPPRAIPHPNRRYPLREGPL